MSTEVGTIKGKTETFDEKTREVGYEDSQLYVTRFHGGERGKCLQLTVDQDRGFIQLTSEGVDELIAKLQKWKECP